MTERGSPPRMRGKRHRIHFAVQIVGITPAHAGKTSPFSCDELDALHHPRACGENLCVTLCVKYFPGSPPRMRGKQANSRPRSRRRGITPAHAGKTLFRRKSHTSDGDHPRACGENLDLQSIFQNFAGSPPRMRGKRPLSQSPAAPAGITPAHAGKTSRGYNFREASGDHPRACGENFPESRVTVP